MNCLQENEARAAHVLCTRMRSVRMLLLTVPVGDAVAVVQRELLQALAALTQRDQSLICEQLAGQAVALEVDLKHRQLLAVHSQCTRQVIRHASHTAGALINGEPPQCRAHGCERQRTQALGVWQHLVILVTVAEALLALCLAGLLRPAACLQNMQCRLELCVAASRAQRD